MADDTKILLTEAEIPTHWVNLMPDLPGEPAPPLRPGRQPAGPDDLTPIFPMGLIAQEVSAEPEIEIPDEVREIYKLWRPTPLFRAYRLERELDTPAHIYYKYEGTSPAGSHKPNTAVPQAYYNREEGVRRLATETGAGQWGSALAFACRLMDMECEVFMVGSSYDQKPYRRSMMEVWGATVHRSPSDQTRPGRAQASHPTGLARHRDLGGGRGGGRRRRHQLRARVGAEPRAAAPDRGGPGVRWPRWRRRASTPTSSSGASAAGRTSPGSSRRSCARTCATASRPGSWPPSPRPVRRSRAASTATTSATRWA